MKLVFLAFLIFHAFVPAVCVGFYGASPVWLFGSVVFSFAVLLTTGISHTAPVKWSLCLVSAIYMLLNLMLGASYYMQGTGFNDQYVYHLGSDTFAVAVNAYGAVFIPAVAGFVVAFFTPLPLYRMDVTSTRSPLGAAVIWMVTVATAYPLHSWVSYIMGYDNVSASSMPEVPMEVLERTDPKSAEVAISVDIVPQQHKANPLVPVNLANSSDKISKNIILIYVEGFEQLYTDQEIFGDLTPNLRELSESAHRFTNSYQMSGTSWTIAGIVASQCGFPLLVDFRMSTNSTIASINRPFVGEECFADILLSRGYATVYMGGAQMEFAGKGNFLKTHGYTRLLGRDELRPLLPDPEYVNSWGLHDDSLFELALLELEQLEQGDRPYLLTLLTLGTHHPKGTMSKSCDYPDKLSNPMSNAIRCSDQLISHFIKEVKERVDMNETIIALFSDHLAIRNTLWNTLKQHKDQRRLLWMVFDNRPGDSSDQVSTHFDLAPTLLEMAGVNSHPQIGMGVSLMAKDARGTSGEPPEIDPGLVPRTMVSSESVRESGFSIAYSDLTISSLHGKCAQAQKPVGRPYCDWNFQAWSG
jgi:phosphoglycerol transferase